MPRLQIFEPIETAFLRNWNKDTQYKLGETVNYLGRKIICVDEKTQEFSFDLPKPKMKRGEPMEIETPDIIKYDNISVPTSRSTSEMTTESNDSFAEIAVMAFVWVFVGIVIGKFML